MSLETIRDSFRVQTLEIRSMDRLIHSDNFAIAYNNATKNEKEKIIKIIKQIDKNGIREFIKRQLLELTPFHRLGVRQLRKIGCNICLPKYWKMNKITLIMEIEHVVSQLKANRK